MCCMLPKISEELIVGIFQGGPSHCAHWTRLFLGGKVLPFCYMSMTDMWKIGETWLSLF